MELHFDSQNYSAHNKGACYGEVGTSAMHFWVAFRKRADAPYNGREDAPAYDYFTGFPAYDNSDTPTAAAARHELFDLDPGKFPDHLVDALLQGMTAVHPVVDSPMILTQEPEYSASDSFGVPNGQPNAEAMGRCPPASLYRYRRERLAHWRLLNRGRLTIRTGRARREEAAVSYNAQSEFDLLCSSNLICQSLTIFHRGCFYLA